MEAAGSCDVMLSCLAPCRAMILVRDLCGFFFFFSEVCLDCVLEGNQYIYRCSMVYIPLST